MTRSRRHLPIIAGFIVLTALWMWPSLRAPGAVIPGTGADDNLTFVWNTWWMHHALTAGRWPLWTSMLFAPWGSSLALNTHAALPSIVGAVLLPVLGSAVAATNVVVAVNLLLNFLASYALAFWTTRSRGAAAVAAIVFGCSPFIGAHLLGHFNLIAAWPLPLAVLVALRRLERATRARVIAAGFAWGSLVYVDYYYAVFAAVMILALLASRAVELNLVRVERSRAERLSLAVLAGLLAIDVVALIAIAATGGMVLRAGGIAVSMQGTDNPIAAAGMLVTLAALIVVSRRLRVSLTREVARHDIRQLVAPLAIGCVVSAPVLLSILALWLAGDYTTQRYFWRSAPPGIDVATVLLGHPSGLLTASWTQRAYAALRIDNVEQSAWLGPAVIVLCAMALRRGRDARGTRLWVVIGAIFATWAIGPYLVAAGARVWLLLPAIVIRFIPVLSNARIPSRAMIVVSLAAAMLAAIGWQRLQQDRRRRLAAGLLLLLLADYFPARPPLFTLDRPLVYEALAQHPDAALCELPLGLRDGFGETGRLDTRVLEYQTRHERPLTGGFVARLPPRLVAAYESDPILGPLARLSAGRPASAELPIDRQIAGARLLGHGIRYVIVNEKTAPPDLMAYVRANLPLRAIAGDAGRTLYGVDLAAVASSPPHAPAKSSR